MTPEQERKVVQRVRAGDADAFEALVRAHEKTVYNIALRMLGNPQDAEDAAQDAFLKAYRSIDALQDSDRFSVWLYRIVSNVCLDQLRARKRRQELSVTVENDEGELEELELPDERFSPAHLLDRKLTREAVQRGLNALNDEARNILLLREIRGLSYEEIGQALNLEPGTVKSRLFRSRKKLCEILLQDGNISDLISSAPLKGGETP